MFTDILYIFSAILGSILATGAICYFGYCSWLGYFQKQRRKVVTRCGEKVLIVGASSGIGRELALQYARRGSDLILVARRKELLLELVEECEKIWHSSEGSRKVLSYSCDITNLEELALLKEFVESNFECLDTLILNAGAISVLTFTKLISQGEGIAKPENSSRLASVESIMKINYVSFVHITAHLLPNINLSRAGNIVVVSSAAGVVGAPTRSLYAASKHALHGFFGSLRMELLAVNSNVQISIICPGSVNTSLRHSAVDVSSSSEGEEVAGTKSGRLEPSQVASRIITASDQSEPLVFIPSSYRHTVWLNHFFPELITRLALKKYGL